MPIESDKDKTIDEALDAASVPPAAGEEDALDSPSPSEVATRINLLGKLIIPATPAR